MGGAMRSIALFNLAFILVSCGGSAPDKENSDRIAPLPLDGSTGGIPSGGNDPAAPSGSPMGSDPADRSRPNAETPPIEPPPTGQPKPGTPADEELDSLIDTFALPERTIANNSANLWATYYYTPRLYHVADGFDLLQLNNSPLGPRLSKRGWCQAAMEGSVQIYFNEKWTTFNYAGVGATVQVDCSDYYDHPVGRTRYKLARGEFGDGVRNFILRPFRTIAVDPDVIPYGRVIYIPQARGLSFTLPDGTTRKHDGYFFAGDTGGLIKRKHIDVFLGIETRSPFPWITSRSSSRIPYEIVNDATLSDAFYKLHTEK